MASGEAVPGSSVRGLRVLGRDAVRGAVAGRLAAAVAAAAAATFGRTNRRSSSRTWSSAELMVHSVTTPSQVAGWMSATSTRGNGATRAGGLLATYSCTADSRTLTGVDCGSVTR